MDKNRKRQLERVFEAPEPVDKRRFFREMEPRPIGMWHILKAQFSYISKWSWGTAALLLGIVVYMSQFYEREMLGVVLSLMPFLALAGVAESVRSSMYGMEELEMSSRFSLKSVILARMAVVGMEDVLLALFFAWIVNGEARVLTEQGSFFRVILYLFAPYLLSACGSLWIVRNFAGKDGLYACAVLALIVSVSAFNSAINFQWIYQERYLSVWLVATVVLGGLALHENRRMLQMIESIG